MAVEREGRLLLAHNAAMPAGRVSVIAGFVEPGETLEETVAREVREEVSIEVQDIRYFGSQSWPFPHSLMLGFTARWKSGELRPDGVEIEGPEGKGFLEADTVIYAAGMRAQRDEAIALSQCAPEFVMLGDCQTPKNIIAATQTAHTAAMLIGTR